MDCNNPIICQNVCIKHLIFRESLYQTVEWGSLQKASRKESKLILIKDLHRQVHVEAHTSTAERNAIE